jgi:benzoate transport
MLNELRQTMDHSPMSFRQSCVIALCVFLISLDGYDVLSISFAAPGIAQEWGVNRAALGVVLSMELIGMGFGAFVLGGIADRIGRRPVALISLCIMALGMYGAAVAQTISMLCIVRLFTGLGIGGVLASISVMSAEFSNLKNRNFCVTLMATGYPLGVIVGGTVASMLLANFDWRAVFSFGAIMTFIAIPLTWYLLPESISFLAQKRPKNTLERINKTLIQIGKSPLAHLPAMEQLLANIGVRRLFQSDLIKPTILLTMAYFTHMMTFYYIMKWIPKLVVDMGFAPAMSGTVLVWANMGGISGCVMLSLLTHKISTKKLVIGALLLSAIAVTLFGLEHNSISQLSMVTAAIGFFTNAAIVGLYAIIARAFPIEVRAGGTGFILGVGRAGAVCGPIVAGFLLQSNVGSLFSVSLLMALGSIVAAFAIFSMPSASDELYE